MYKTIENISEEKEIARLIKKCLSKKCFADGEKFKKDLKEALTKDFDFNEAQASAIYTEALTREIATEKYSYWSVALSAWNLALFFLKMSKVAE